MEDLTTLAATLAALSILFLRFSKSLEFDQAYFYAYEPFTPLFEIREENTQMVESFDRELSILFLRFGKAREKADSVYLCRL